MKSLWVTGIGAVSPVGFDVEAQYGGGGSKRRVPEELPVKEGFPQSAVRWLDRPSLWWCNAASRALQGAPSAKCGQVAGLGWGSITPVREIETAVFRQGFAAMPPATFPFSVGNAPAGQASLLLKLRGGCVTLSGKEAAGLAAAVEACRLCEAGLMDDVIAGGVDHLDAFLLEILSHLRPAGSAPLGEGAYVLRITASDAKPASALCRVSGWSQAGAPCEPHRYPEAGPLFDSMAAKLRDRFGLALSRPSILFLPGEIPPLRSSSLDWAGLRCPNGRVAEFQNRLGACGASWAGAAGLAALALSRGEAESALLMAVATGGAACALALESA